MVSAIVAASAQPYHLVSIFPFITLMVMTLDFRARLGGYPALLASVRPNYAPRIHGVFKGALSLHLDFVFWLVSPFLAGFSSPLKGFFWVSSLIGPGVNNLLRSSARDVSEYSHLTYCKT